MQRMHRLGLKAALTALIYRRPRDVERRPRCCGPTTLANTPTSPHSPTATRLTPTTRRPRPASSRSLNVPFLLTNGQNAERQLQLESNVTPTARTTSSRRRSPRCSIRTATSWPARSTRSTIYGTVVIGGTRRTPGCCSPGTPTAFGSQSLKPLGVDE